MRGFFIQCLFISLGIGIGIILHLWINLDIRLAHLESKIEKIETLFYLDLDADEEIENE